MISDEERLFMVEQYMKQPRGCFVAKNSEKADTYRAEGNVLFQAKLFFDAIVKYNESLCLALATSSQMALAYANRSAVYMECGLYDLCLENIKLAVANNYPPGKLYQLEDRKLRCEGYLNGSLPNPNPHINKFKEEDEVKEKCRLKLSYECNPKIPFIIKSLRQQHDVDGNRDFIVSDIDLKVGDVISVEDGFCKTRFMSTVDGSQYERCAECLSENMLNLRPCDLCAQAMFCSDECYARLKEFHQHRCDIFTNMIDFASVQFRALKFFSHALAHFGTIESMKEFVDDTKGTVTSVFDYDFSDPRKNSENYIKLTLNSMPLEYDEWKGDADDQQAKLSKEIFFSEPEMQKLINEHCDFIEQFLSRMYKVVTSQTSIIIGNDLQKGNFKTGEVGRVELCPVGGAVCAFWQSMGHSCSPNTERVCVNGTTIVFVLRPIAAGEEITNMKHSFPSWKYSKVDRELKVEELFPFVKQPCECLACTSNFLTLDEAPTGDREVLLQAEKNFEMTLTALQGFPCSVASQLDVICGEYDQILRKDTNINEFPKTEFIMWERAVFNAFFVACKVHSIWPLLRREFYDSPGEFLNENILSAGAAVVSCETIGKKS